MFEYQLPDDQGQTKTYKTESNSVIIIGANGSGKSKLGAWMETHNYAGIHRIGAQRNLNFDENIKLKSFSEAEDLVLFGGTDKELKKTKFHRWNGGRQLTTKLMDDFENILAALLALKVNEQDSFVELCKEAERQGQMHPPAPITVVDRLQMVWRSIYPQRNLIIEDSKFYAELEYGGDTKRYSANQMSDGERAVLYLAAQVLCVPREKTMIIDEPEVHLHKTIMNTLWHALEVNRNDCLFIYITHDTQFASMHASADKYWVQSYDGAHWGIEKLQKSELPEQLRLEILGNRKDVLFVEGNEGSFDTELYSYMFPKYHVIPCGSCTQVIARTKAFRNSEGLHHCKVFGIIDRDYRSQYEIDSYKNDGIFTIDVAEVENLFIVEEVLTAYANHMCEPADVVEEIKCYVIQQRFKEQIERQICQCIVAELKYRLSSMEIEKKSEEEAKKSIDNIKQVIDYDSVKAERESEFRTAIDTEDYAAVIRLFNEKGIAKSIGHFLGVQNQDYCQSIVNFIRGGNNAFIDAIRKYMPSEIPNE